MQLSRLENNAFEILLKNNLQIFKAKDLELLVGITSTKAYNLIKSLKKKGAIKKAGKSFLALSNADDFIIATRLCYPSYISFWTALSYYGFSDQTPIKIFLATTRYTPEINNFRYVTISKNRFFGYTLIGEVPWAEKEKAIVDSLLYPKYAGGIKEIMKACSSAIKVLNLDLLIEYALKVKSKAVLRRLGYILECNHCLDRKLDILRKNIGKGYEKLDPTLSKRNNWNKKWLIDINI